MLNLIPEPALPFRLVPRVLTPAEAELSGASLTTLQQADQRRRGYPVPSGGERKVRDAAMLLLVKMIGEARLGPAIAWSVVEPAVVSLVVRAARIPGAIHDKTRDRILQQNPSLLIRIGFDLAEANHGGGEIFAWSSKVQPSCYASADDAFDEIYRRDSLAVAHMIRLTPLAEFFVKELGWLGSIEDRAED